MRRIEALAVFTAPVFRRECLEIHGRPADVERRLFADPGFMASEGAPFRVCQPDQRIGLGWISVIIPALNEAAVVARSVRSALGDGIEVLVVDGGSVDGTIEKAAAAGARVLTSAAGRARQMNAGGDAALGTVLVFLHADTVLPAGWPKTVAGILAQPGVAAGAFRLKIEGSGINLRIMEIGAGIRNRLGFPYGDQALFMTADTFHRAGGFPIQDFAEDAAMVRRLKKLGSVIQAPKAVLTSARRWRSLGPWRAWFINQILMAGYLFGVRPARLAGLYRRWEDKK